MIPLNNSLSKAEAFIPSLSKDFVKNQRVKRIPEYINTLPILSSLQEKGWELKYGRDLRNKNSKKPTFHRFHLHHPDLKMNETNSKHFKSKSFAQINVVNSCDGKSPLQLNIGAYRQICSNGLMGWSSVHNMKIKHNSDGFGRIESALNKINDYGQSMIDTFKSFQNVILTSNQLKELTNEALKIRFGDTNSDAMQLNHIRRNEDVGDDLWTIFNRIQENLTSSTLLINENGQLVNRGRITSTSEDIKVNTQLTALAASYV